MNYLGHGGGGEQLADYVLRSCELKWQKKKAEALTPKAKAQIMERIKRRRASWGPRSEDADDEETFEFNDSKGIGAGDITLTKAEINVCWNQAHLGLLRLVQQELRTLRAEFKSEEKRGTAVRPLVVVAGGSLTNVILMDKVKLMIEGNQLGPPLVVTKEGVAHELVF